MTKDDLFEALVRQAIDSVPEPYAERLGEINFVVEDEPSPEQRQRLKLRDCDALFGLYEGIPLPSRGGALLAKVPDVITIFRHPMTEIFRVEAELKKQIFETVWHEVAHYYGLDHKRIADIKHRKN